MVGVIVQHQSSVQVVADIAEDLRERVEIAVGWNKRTVLAAGRSLKQKGAKVLVVRGPWLGQLRESTDLPVYDYNPDGVDLLRVLTRAKRIASAIGILNVYGYSGDWRVFEDALGVRILASGGFTEPESEVPGRLEALRRQGAKVFVGGELALRQAEAMGMPALYLESGPQTIRGALHKAGELIRGIHKENERTQVLQTVLDNINEGVVAFSSGGEVIAGNRMAAEMAEMKEVTPGVRLSAFPPAWREVSALDARDTAPRMRSIRDRKVFLEGFPIVVDGLVTAGIIISQEIHRVQRAEAYIRKDLYDRGFVARHTFEDLVSTSKGMRNTIVLAKQYATKSSSVLILGETGAGKELLAQSMHNASDRRSYPFVAVNCAALPESLLESELFGYEEGAFTGARKGGKPGLFEIAHGGTVFLDEISSMSLAVQARLLRVLEERSVVRLGGDTVVPLDIRLIAACNDDLAKKVSQGAFREDLFFRLAVLVIRIPPLRERPDDVEPLLRHFLGLDQAAALPFSESVLESLKRCAWPGNVRQLESFAQRFAALADISSTSEEAARQAMDNFAELLDPGSRSQQADSSEVVVIHRGSLADMTSDMLSQVAQTGRGSMSSLATQLGVSRSGLWKMLRRHGIKSNGRKRAVLP